MKRDPALVPLSWEHHHGLVMAVRIEKSVATLGDHEIGLLYNDLIAFWAQGLLPHFRAENECLLARIVRHVDPEHPTVRRTQQDHLGMEALVATMRDTRDVGVRREALARFGTWLREHIRWEEAVLFEETQQLLGAGEMEALGEELRERLPEVPVPPPNSLE